YLWHWPVITITRWHYDLDIQVIIFMAAATLVLAALSYRFVETPFRERSAVRDTSTVYGGLLASATCAALLIGPISVSEVDAGQPTRKIGFGRIIQGGLKCHSPGSQNA